MGDTDLVLQSMTHMIYRIAESSELLASLREEVESIIADHGWSVPALGLMRKLDSLMRESQRLDGISICTFRSYPLATDPTLTPHCV